MRGLVQTAKVQAKLLVIYRADMYAAAGKQLEFNTGNTCRLALVPVRAAELPSLCAGALVGRVAWFTELGAAFVLFQGAQSLVCIVETERDGCSTHTPNGK